jgi:hypothetical protein
MEVEKTCRLLLRECLEMRDELEAEYIYQLGMTGPHQPLTDNLRDLLRVKQVVNCLLREMVAPASLLELGLARVAGLGLGLEELPRTLRERAGGWREARARRLNAWVARAVGGMGEAGAVLQHCLVDAI